MSRTALRTRGLVKRFGREVALAGLDLEVPAGTICGLIGPNGAGKTTAFGAIAGLIRLDAGQVELFEQGPFEPLRHAGRLGMLPQDCEFSRDTTVRGLLVYYARLAGLDTSAARRAAHEILVDIDLAERSEARVQQLSHGMRRRLQVGQALLGSPELILLDEPMSGLDPELVVRMRQLLLARRDRCTLLISSHNLQELESICDHVAFMDSGRCTHQGPLAELTNRGLCMRYKLEASIELDPSVLPLPFVWDGTTLVVEGRPDQLPADVNRQALPGLLEAGARIVEVRSGRSLETAYLESRRA